MSVPKLRFPGFAGEWEEKAIGERLSKVIDYRGKAPPKSESGMPLITARNVRMGFLDFTADEYIEEHLYKSWMNRGLPKPNDVLFTTEAPLGNVALYPSTGTYALGQRIITLQPKASILDSVFLFQYLLGPLGQDAVEKRGTGSTAKGIKSKVFVKIPMAIPSLPEQQKIAAFLGAVDAKLAALAAKQAALVRFKTGLMQKLFSQQIRFMQDDGGAFPEWEERELRAISIINPKSPKLPERFRYIDLESVNAGTLGTVSEIDATEAPSRAQRVLQRGDILFQMVRPYQRNNFYFDLVGVYVGSTGYAQIKAKQNPHYLFHVLHTDEFVNRVLERCTGTGYPAINSNDLGKITVPLPHPDEQQKIADALSAMDAKIQAVADQVSKLQTFKKGLLQQMFV